MEYRARFVRSDGNVAGTTTLLCDDDNEARVQAQQLVGVFGIELVGGERVIERLKPAVSRLRT